MRNNEERWITVGRGLLVLAAGAWLAWAASGLTASGDYASRGPVGGDNAGPILLALAHGHVSQAASLQPLMGLTSIVWRLPFVVLADLLGGSERLVYALGALACLLPAVGLVAWLARRAASSRQLMFAALAAAAIVAGPATSQAIQLGHPEEILATVLTLLAVITASQGRHGWAAVLLGLASATKQWALLAAPCVLLALPDRRLAVAVRAALVAGIAAFSLPLADPAAFARAQAIVSAPRVDWQFSLWSPVGLLLGNSGVNAHLLPAGLTRSQASAAALLLALAAVWVYARRRGSQRSQAVDVLPLLALFGLLRCVCDPNPWSYYFLPLMIPLAVWEAGTLRRLPIVTGLCCAAVSLGPSAAYRVGGDVFASPIVSFVWIGAVAVLACYLASCAVGPDRVPLALGAHRPQPARAG